MTEHEVKAAPIGMRVVVRGVQRRTHRDGMCVWACESWQCFEWPRQAFLVGWVTASDGKHSGDTPAYGLRFYNAARHYALARIRFTPQGREYYAMPEDIKPIGERVDA